MSTLTDDAIDEIDRETAKTTDVDAMPAVNTSDVPTAPPEHKLVDPFAHYAEIEGGEAFFDGDYLKLDQKSKEYVRGQKKEPVGATEVFVANLHEARHGWIKFGEEGVQRQTWLIVKRPELLQCPACGDTVDDHDDKRCDWRPTIYLPMRSGTGTDDLVCFTGGGKGARRAVAQLCGIYAREGANRRGKSPAITLQTWSFENKSGGTTTWPDFSNIVGWEFFEPGVATPEPKPVAVPIAPPTPAKTVKALPPKRDDMDDQIPF